MKRWKVTFANNNNFVLGTLGDDGAIFVTDTIRYQHDNDWDMENDDDDDSNGDQIDSLNMSEHTKILVRRSTKRKNNHHAHQTNFDTSSLCFYSFETFGLVKDKDWHTTLPEKKM